MKQCLSPFLGTLGYNESSFHMEMSQIGFSTHTLDVSLFMCVFEKARAHTHTHLMRRCV